MNQTMSDGELSPHMYKVFADYSFRVRHAWGGFVVRHEEQLDLAEKCIDSICAILRDTLCKLAPRLEEICSTIYIHLWRPFAEPDSLGRITRWHWREQPDSPDGKEQIEKDRRTAFRFYMHIDMLMRKLERFNNPGCPPLSTLNSIFHRRRGPSYSDDSGQCLEEMVNTVFCLFGAKADARHSLLPHAETSLPNFIEIVLDTDILNLLSDPIDSVNLSLLSDFQLRDEAEGLIQRWQLLEDVGKNALMSSMPDVLDKMALLHYRVHFAEAANMAVSADELVTRAYFMFAALAQNVRRLDLRNLLNFAISLPGGEMGHLNHHLVTH